MNIVDWRRVDARALTLVFARERVRWLSELGWETRENWLHVERARSTWGLPGLAALDDGGRVRGLTFFHRTDARVDIGGLFAEQDAVREALLDAAMEASAESGAAEVAAFVYVARHPMVAMLSARGFSCDRVDYLELALAGVPEQTVLRSAGEVVVRDWGAGDVDALAGLLHVSYDAASARRFVSEPGEHSWRGYLGALIQHHACGSILPGATRMAVADGRLVGAALATELGPGTAHLAQVVVHPDWRGRGLAGDLIDEAARLARHHGRSRMTLLASASNGPAQTLYRGRGYVGCGEFVSAIRPLSGLVAKAS